MGGGGGKGSKSAKAPDYTAIAKEQGVQDRLTAQEQTQANRPNQTDMFGNTLTWNQSKVPTAASQQAATYHADLTNQYNAAMASGNKKEASRLAKLGQANEKNLGQTQDQWNQSVNLSPEQQILMNQQNARAQYAGQQTNDLLGRAGTSLSQPFSLEMMQGYDPSAAYGRGDVNVPQYDPSSGNAVSDALYRSVMDRTAPQQARETGTLENRLRAQGLQPGTEAFNRAMINLQTAHGDVQTQAAQNAVLGGYQEARDIYGAQLAGNQQQAGQLQYADQAGRDAYATYLQGVQARNQTGMTNRYLPLTEAAQFAQYAGGPQTGFEGFAGATGYNAADLTGAAQAQAQYGLAQQNASNSMKGSVLGAGATLGGSYLGGK